MILSTWKVNVPFAVMMIDDFEYVEGECTVCCYDD